MKIFLVLYGVHSFYISLHGLVKRDKAVLTITFKVSETSWKTGRDYPQKVKPNAQKYIPPKAR